MSRVSDAPVASRETLGAEPDGADARGAISLRRITKRYGDERVVDAVSLEIRPGEFFSLLGPSGSGKTTTLMMIAGFAELEEGQILIDGTDIAAEPPQRRGFGMVFQNYAIFPHLNVFENVAFPLRARRVPGPEIERHVRDALALVRLERFGERFARQLSGGQQQRVAIARAMATRCCWPPESWRANRSAKRSSRTSSSALVTRSRISLSASLRARNGNATFSNTFRCGKIA